MASTRFGVTHSLRGDEFQRLLELGFRRSGTMVYRPDCSGCEQCRPLRVLTQSFRPDRSMRRNWRDNQDLDPKIVCPEPTRAKFELYCRYLKVRHESSGYDGFVRFLYNSPVETHEIEFRLKGELVCVA